MDAPFKSVIKKPSERTLRQFVHKADANASRGMFQRIIDTAASRGVTLNTSAEPLAPLSDCDSDDYNARAITDSLDSMMQADDIRLDPKKCSEADRHAACQKLLVEMFSRFAASLNRLVEEAEQEPVSKTPLEEQVEIEPTPKNEPESDPESTGPESTEPESGDSPPPPSDPVDTESESSQS